MPAARLTDRQKAEVVERFRNGEGTQNLAVLFRCSANTVSRAVKAALSAEEYEQLKDRRSRRQGGVRAEPAGEGVGSRTLSDAPVSDAAAAPSAAVMAEDGGDQADPEPLEGSAADDDDSDGPGVLAIDDADDFGDDDDDLLGDDDGEDPSVFVPIPLLAVGELQAEIRPRPLEAAELPTSAYMLVDKTVELQPRPLSDFTELGCLPQEELERRALLVFVNPRQAKRLCGRSQRVIKIPDTAVLERTAPFLLAQGISRVVIEGTLFSLPGS